MRKMLTGALWFGLSLAHTDQALAEYDKSKLIDAMTRYVAINDVMEKLSKTVCNSTVQFDNTTQSAIQETTSEFKSQDRDWIRAYYSSPSAKAKLANNNIYIERYLTDARKEGMDERTACAPLAGMVLTLHHQAKEAWVATVKEYGQ